MHYVGLTRGYFACDVGLMGFRPSLLVSDSFDFGWWVKDGGLLFLKSKEGLSLHCGLRIELRLLHRRF